MLLQKSTLSGIRNGFGALGTVIGLAAGIALAPLAATVALPVGAIMGAAIGVGMNRNKPAAAMIVDGALGAFAGAVGNTIMPFLPVAVACGLSAQGLATLATLPAERQLAREAAARKAADKATAPETAAPAGAPSVGTGPALTQRFAASGTHAPDATASKPAQNGPKPR